MVKNKIERKLILVKNNDEILETTDLRKTRTFTLQLVFVLLEEIKEFDAGAIDEYLTNYIDRVFENWLKNR